MIRFLVLLLLPAAVMAQEGVLPLERIYAKPYIAGSRPEAVALSPDGATILYRRDTTARGTYRLWRMNADGNGKEMIADTLVGEIAWSPDGRSAACTRKGDLFFCDPAFAAFTRVTKSSDGASSLAWSKDGRILVFRQGGALLAVSPGKPGFTEIAKSPRKEVSERLVDLTPDGRRALIAESDREGEKEFLVPHFTGKDVTTSPLRSGLAKTRYGIAPVDTGATVWIKLPGEERFYGGDAAIAPDGRSLFIERFSADRRTRELFVAGIDSGKAKRIYDEHDDAWVEGGLATTRWMPDGKSIVTTSEREGWNQLYIMRADGSGRKRLTHGDWEVHWFDITPDGKTILFQANKDDLQQWQMYSLDIAGGAITRLSTRTGSYENPAMAGNGSVILADYSDFNRPTELAAIALHAPGAPAATDGHAAPPADRLLTDDVPAEFKSIHWITPEIVHFKARDGASVPAMVYRPEHPEPGRKYPTVVFVHGAGYLQNVERFWSYYYREAMFHTRLVQRGYVVVEIDYRGSAGYGRKFRTDIEMHLGGKDLDDEVDGLEYLSRFGYIDTQRVGIYGGSYGGFMTLMGLFCTDKYACGAALRAVTSWENYYRHNAWYTGARLGTPEDHPDAYKISSPITYADSLRRPLLILHGMVDDNVFFQDAVQLVAKLQKAKKPFELMVYPDEAHAFTEPDSWLDEYGRIEQFFDAHLLSR